MGRNMQKYKNGNKKKWRENDRKKRLKGENAGEKKEEGENIR